MGILLKIIGNAYVLIYSFSWRYGKLIFINKQATPLLGLSPSKNDFWVCTGDF